MAALHQMLDTWSSTIQSNSSSHNLKSISTCQRPGLKWSISSYGSCIKHGTSLFNWGSGSRSLWDRVFNLFNSLHKKSDRTCLFFLQEQYKFSLPYSNIIHLMQKYSGARERGWPYISILGRALHMGISWSTALAFVQYLLCGLWRQLPSVTTMHPSSFVVLLSALHFWVCTPSVHQHQQQPGSVTLGVRSHSVFIPWGILETQSSEGAFKGRNWCCEFTIISYHFFLAQYRVLIHL